MLLLLLMISVQERTAVEKAETRRKALLGFLGEVKTGDYDNEGVVEYTGGGFVNRTRGRGGDGDGYTRK